jgi:hypothetical protein
LGAAAQAELDSYNNLMGQIAQKTTDVQQKTRLSVDLSGLNSAVNTVGPALVTFRGHLQDIEGVWTDMSMNMAFIANNYSDDQLASLPWVTQTLRVGDATTKWQNIGATAQQFTQHSLVSFDHSVSFGTPIPTLVAA